MANAFTNATSRSIAVTSEGAATKIGSYDVPAFATAILMQLLISNRTAAAVKVCVMHVAGANITYLVGGPTASTMGATIAPGDSLVVIGGEHKMVLLTTESIKVFVDSGSVDAVISVMEMT